MGQDTGTLSDFKSEVLDKYKYFPRPDGTTIYTNLVYTPDLGNTAPLQGFYQTANYGSGRNDFIRQLDAYDGALSVGLFLKDSHCDTAPNAELRNIPLRAVAGDPTVDASILSVYDKKLDEMINYLKATDRTILLRIGYEFDGVWNCYTPETYVNAFKSIKKRIIELKASNIYTVWQSANYHVIPQDPRMANSHNTNLDDHFERWYPGDEYVDVVGMSFFVGKNYLDYAYTSQCIQDRGTLIGKSPREIQNELLDFSRKHNKPVMISEAAPQGLDLENLTARCVSGYLPDSQFEVTEREIFNLWFKDYFEFIYKNKDVIKAAAYINTNWDSQPLWACNENACGNGYWGDSRIQANKKLLFWFTLALKILNFKNSPEQSTPFYPPYPPIVDGKLEAEYANNPFMWSLGDINPGYGDALTDPNTSNMGTYIIYADGGSIEFQNNVTESSSILIRYATVTESGDPENPFQFSVMVDGEKVADVPFVNTGLNYVDAIIPADVKDGSVITLQLSSGFVIWFDYIVLDN